VQQVFDAAYASFRSGLTVCLFLAAGLIALAAIISWTTA
jgi:hypothetical protein